MLLGEEGLVHWPDVFKVLGGAALALIPGYLAYRLKKREEEPVIDAKKQRVRSKDKTLEQDMYDHLFSKYQEMLEDIQTKVNKLEVDHLTCQVENSRLKERCDNQTHKIEELTCELDKVASRVRELEAQANGV